MNDTRYSKQDKEAQLKIAMQAFEILKNQGLQIDMSRGKPCKEQLLLSENLLHAIPTVEDAISEDGTDCKNYGGMNGIYEARKLMGDLLDIPAENIIISGNSSLNMMFDCIANAFLFGVNKGKIPWGKQGKIKFLCPVPGYDRHFAICQKF
ncbi:MAG: aminotransferase, partial [Oscillospiraceae bacterium]